MATAMLCLEIHNVWSLVETNSKCLAPMRPAVTCDKRQRDEDRILYPRNRRVRMPRPEASQVRAIVAERCKLSTAPQTKGTAQVGKSFMTPQVTSTRSNNNKRWAVASVSSVCESCISVPLRPRLTRDGLIGTGSQRLAARAASCTRKELERPK